MITAAPYDEVADWYENEFLVLQRSFGHDDDAPPDGEQSFADRLGIDEALVKLLGAGSGTILEVGCGTGVYAERLGQLGWTPLGVDLSSGMLNYAKGRLPIAQGDALALPFADGSLNAVVAIMVHTDMPGYPGVLKEIHRVLSPGGTFVHIGVHPCFCGGFADRTDPRSVVIRPGYLDGEWTKESWTTMGLRDKVGASHYPLAQLMNTLLETGFEFQQFAEGAQPTPVTLSLRATKRA